MLRPYLWVNDRAIGGHPLTGAEKCFCTALQGSCSLPAIDPLRQGPHAGAAAPFGSQILPTTELFFPLQCAPPRQGWSPGSGWLCSVARCLFSNPRMTENMQHGAAGRMRQKLLRRGCSKSLYIALRFTLEPLAHRFSWADKPKNIFLTCLFSRNTLFQEQHYILDAVPRGIVWIGAHSDRRRSLKEYACEFSVSMSPAIFSITRNVPHRRSSARHLLPAFSCFPPFLPPRQPWRNPLSTHALTHAIASVSQRTGAHGSKQG